MYLEIYVDILFAINFTLNYVVLWLVGKTRKQKSVIWRRMLASGIGSLFVCISVIIPNTGGSGFTMVLQGVLAICMVLIAFQYTNKKNVIENIISFYIASFFIAGFLNFMAYHTNFFFYLKELADGKAIHRWKSVFLVIGAGVGAVVFLLWAYFLRKEKRKRELLFSVELQFHDRVCRMQGLLDTGNSLRDPVSGSPVLIVEYTEAKPLFTENFQRAIEVWMKNEWVEEITDLEDIDRIRMIPYHSIGREKGLLTGVVLDRVKVLSADDVNSTANGENVIAEKEKVILAFYEGRLSNKNEYHIILHEAVMK